MMSKEKNYPETPQSVQSDSARVKALMRASFFAMGVDVFLVLLKYALSRITGNAVFLADALHSTADFAVSFMVLLSIIVNYTFHGSKRARHAEALAAFLISLLLIFGSYQMFYYVLTNKAGSFFLVSDVFLVIAFIGISIDLLITFKMSNYKKHIGKMYESAAFSAEGDHTFSDFLSSVAVWATLLLGYFGIHIERIITFIIAIIVLNIGIKLLIKSLKLFGLQFKIFSRVVGTLHADVINKLRKIEGYLKHLTEKIISGGILSRNFITKDIKLWIKLNILLIAFLYLGTGFYRVLLHQTGLELLFGKVTEKNPPGLHYNPPVPFGNRIIVDTTIMTRLECGFRTDMNYEGEEPPVYLWENMHNVGKYTKVSDEALAIAGDENLIDINFICYYLIADPVQYALNNENAHETLRNLMVYEIHSICGQYRLDELLSSERGKIQERLLVKMKNSAEELSIGVNIRKIYIQEAHPPIEVIPQYRYISSAREKKDEIIHKASAYANDLLPRSRGEASALISDSTAYAEEKVNEAGGGAESFKLKQQNFYRYRDISKKQLWWQVVTRMLSEKKIFILPSRAERRFYKSEKFVEPEEVISGGDED